MAQLNYDGDMANGMGGFGTGSNPLLWLITLGFLKGDNGFLGGGGNGDAGAGVLAGQPQAKLDCLQQGHNNLMAQISSQTEADRFIALNAQINNLEGIQRDSTSELAGIQRDSTAAITAQMNDLRAEQAKCCCETQLGIERTRNDIATQTATLVADGLRNTQTILDRMCANELSAVQAENTKLQSELNKAEIISALSCGNGRGVATA